VEKICCWLSTAPSIIISGRLGVKLGQTVTNSG